MFVATTIFGLFFHSATLYNMRSFVVQALAKENGICAKEKGKSELSLHWHRLSQSELFMGF